MKVVGYTSPEVLEVLAAPTTRLRPVSLEIMLSLDGESTVPLAVALPPVEGVSLGDGWWNDDGNIYTVPLDVGPWGARIEVRGHSIDEARMLAFRVLEGLT